MQQRAQALIKEILAPLIEADGGKIEFVEMRDDEVVVRLSGTCAGCPGQPYTLEHILRPAVEHRLGKGVKVTVESP